MRILTLALVANIAAGWSAADEAEAARAWHRQEATTWSYKTSLPLETIQRLWHATMGDDADDRFGQGIEVVDASTLRTRNHVLFITAAGNGHCLHLYVFGNGGRDKNPRWELSGLPNDGGGICHERLLPYPTAYARADGEIVVQIPTSPAWIKRTLGNENADYPISTALAVYVYRWDGKTYKLAEMKKVVTYKSDKLDAEKCTEDAPCPH